MDILVAEQKAMFSLRNYKKSLTLYASGHDTEYFYPASVDSIMFLDNL